MQVSNSTGSNTDYRVGTNSGGGASMNSVQSGGAQTASIVGGGGEVDLGGATNGCLPPGESTSLSSGGPCWIEFRIGETMVASQSFNEDPGVVELLVVDGQYVIRVQAANAA